MGLSRLFGRKPESPDERRALANLDEATREVAWQELEKENQRERRGLFGPLIGLRPRTPRSSLRRLPGDPVLEPADDPDPPDDRSLREVMHEHDRPE